MDKSSLIYTMIDNVYKRNLELDDMKSQIGELHFRKEMCDIHINLGRQMGHTKAGIQLCYDYENSLILTKNNHMSKKVINDMCSMVLKNCFKTKYLQVDMDTLKQKVKPIHAVMDRNKFKGLGFDDWWLPGTKQYVELNRKEYDMIIVDDYSICDERTKEQLDDLIRHTKLLVKLQ